jgi:serine/threonine-protein kinase
MSAEATPREEQPLRIGRYRVLKHVATGGMGAVYRARDVVESRDVALKVLASYWVEKPHILERFRREGRIGQTLSHENIVAYYDTGEDNGFYYHAMEYVSGVDLKEYVTNKARLDVGESRYFLVQAVRALDHLYENRVVHRDIKPANFLVAIKDGKPFLKLIDFGLARRLGEASTIVAIPGTTVGTVDYIAPEQAQDRTAADVRSDIYALGCTWYHMLTGFPPFLADTKEEKFALRMNEDVPDVRERNPDVPQEAVEILNRMMARSQAYRYQKPGDLLHDLETLVVPGDSAPSQIVRRIESKPAARPSRGFLIFFLIALLAGAAVAVWALWSVLRGGHSP